jgi:hypothetical protein
MFNNWINITSAWHNTPTATKYRVIHKSLRDFRPLQYTSRDSHAEEEHVNRGRDTPNFCPTLQVLDMSTLGDAADVNSVIKFLPHTLQYLAVDSSDCLHDLLSLLSRGTGSTYLRPMPCDSPCVAGTWLQGWHLPRHQEWTYGKLVR